MQFHLNRFQVGDPEIAEPSPRALARKPPSRPPAEVDVLIVGCGPAGLTLAAQLSAFPEIETCIVEKKDGPLELGQADGVACRTMEMFNAFGFAEKVLREAYWVNETTFWGPDRDAPGNIIRSDWVKDTEDGLSEFPHVILNQARVHEFYLDVMRKSPNRLAPHYGWEVRDVSVDAALADRPGARPVTVTLKKTAPAEDGETRQIRAKYVIGCDGARSQVRKSLGLELKGDSANQAWGVMDVLVRTDFPDLRKKSIIRSGSGGSIVLIPREGGHLARFYVEQGKLPEGQRAAQSDIALGRVIETTREILSPYSFDVQHVAWWSIYEIGQRLSDRFDDVDRAAGESRQPRVFIAGDACHTHSPKAGQGMNVSMQDAFNLGWKLAAVLTGRSAPGLLDTYTSERRAIAEELINFDREWAAMLSAPLKHRGDEGPGVTAQEIQEYFVRAGQYTAGTATRYAPSELTDGKARQDLAKGLSVGKRFHSAPAIRFADAKPMHLGHMIEADGRWRILVFAGPQGPGDQGSDTARLLDFLHKDKQSPLLRYTPDDADLDSVIDVRAVYQQGHHEFELADCHAVLKPTKGSHALTDYEKIFCADPAQDIFDMRGIDRTTGCVVVVRPDQFVGTVLAPTDHEALARYFEPLLLTARQQGEGAGAPALEAATRLESELTFQQASHDPAQD